MEVHGEGIRQPEFQWNVKKGKLFFGDHECKVTVGEGGETPELLQHLEQELNAQRFSLAEHDVVNLPVGGKNVQVQKVASKYLGSPETLSREEVRVVATVKQLFRQYGSRRIDTYFERGHVRILINEGYSQLISYTELLGLLHKHRSQIAEALVERYKDMTFLTEYEKLGKLCPHDVSLEESVEPLDWKIQPVGDRGYAIGVKMLDGMP
jgi:hypothetical protein